MNRNKGHWPVAPFNPIYFPLVQAKKIVAHPAQLKSKPNVNYQIVQKILHYYEMPLAFLSLSFPSSLSLSLKDPPASSSILLHNSSNSEYEGQNVFASNRRSRRYKFLPPTWPESAKQTETTPNFSLKILTIPVSIWLPTPTDVTIIMRRTSRYPFSAWKWQDNVAEIGVGAVEERERSEKTREILAVRSDLTAIYSPFINLDTTVQILQ